MSVSEKKRQLVWSHMLTNTIQKRNLYGRSFTAGVALFTLASEGWLDDEMENELEALLYAYVGEDLIDDMAKRGLRTWARDLVHLVDLAVLDEIARELEGEGEE